MKSSDSYVFIIISIYAILPFFPVVGRGDGGTGGDATPTQRAKHFPRIGCKKKNRKTAEGKTTRQVSKSKWARCCVVHGCCELNTNFGKPAKCDVESTVVLLLRLSVIGMNSVREKFKMYIFRCLVVCFLLLLLRSRHPIVLLGIFVHHGLGKVGNGMPPQIGVGYFYNNVNNEIGCDLIKLSCTSNMVQVPTCFVIVFIVAA